MKPVLGKSSDRLAMTRSISLVLAASTVLLSLPHYSWLPVLYLREFRFDMVSEIVWYITTNNVVYAISLRDILSYLRWLPLAILAGYACRSAIYKRAMPRAINTGDRYIVAFLVFLLISCLYSIDPRVTLLRSASVILMYLSVFWGVWVIADEVGEKKVVRIVVNAAAIMFCLHIVVAVLDPENSFPYLGRFEGWMINPGTAAGYAAVFLPLSLYLALQRSGWQYRVLVAAIVFVLIMSQTRTELVSASIGTLFFLFFIYPKRRLISIVSVTMVLIVAFVWIQVGPRLFPQATDFSWNKIAAIVPMGNNDDAYLESDNSELTSVDLIDTNTIAPDTNTNTDTNTIAPHTNTNTDTNTIAPKDTTVDLEEVIDSVSEVDVTANIVNRQEKIDLKVLYREKNPRSEHFISLSSRTGKWRMGLQYLLERPLQGFGFGTEHQLFSFHQVDENDYIRTGEYFHNSYLGLALQVGIIGALMLYVPLGILLFKEVRFLFIDRNDSFRASLLAVSLTSMIGATASSDLYSMGNAKAFPFWISIMLLVRYSYGNKIAKKR